MEPAVTHIFIGLLASALLAIFLILSAGSIWNIQKEIVESLLTFANVEFQMENLPFNDLKNGIPTFYEPGGNVFNVPIKYMALSPLLAMISIAVLLLFGFFSYRLKIIPLPFKVLILFLLTLVTSTILYTTFVSPIPPHTIGRLTVDWQYSGIIIWLLIAAIFSFSVFPIKGPLWIKFMWLAIALFYSFIWNSVRLSVVLGSLYYLGSSVFLLTHYLTGIYIDFIYIVAFYALALAHLAKKETSEVGW